MTRGIFRTSDKVYKSRPPANCRSARAAWDYHAEAGAIVWMRLLDGYWGAKRENGDIDECENTNDLTEYRIARAAAKNWCDCSAFGGYGHTKEDHARAAIAKATGAA